MKKGEALNEVDKILSDIQKSGSSNGDLSIALFMADLRLENLTKEEIVLLYKNTGVMSPLWNTLNAIVSGNLSLDTHQTRSNRWMK